MDAAVLHNPANLQYLPYGEPYINQRTSGYNERFTFTGKERDEETGYGYFGARYMDHELMTMWLSVDPMADKYPGVSPYNYCLWNPVKFIDPDGNSPIKGITSAIKIARKAYKIYRKTGKLTPKALKNAGLSELVDIAGDMVTIFSGDASVLDRVAAVADLAIGTNFNTQGNRKVVEKAAQITKKGLPQIEEKRNRMVGENTITPLTIILEICQKALMALEKTKYRLT